MKQFTLFFFAFFSLLIMMSCKDDVSKQLDNNKQTMTEEKGLICFPKLALQGSRSEQDANDWENWSKVLLAAYSGGYPFSISGDIRSVPS